MNASSHVSELRRGFRMLETGRVGEAEAIAHQGLKHNKKDSLVHALLGQIAETRGHHAAATKHYRDAIRCDPRQIMPYIALGQSETELGRYPQAIASLKKALNINPDFPNAIAALADAYDKQGESNKALELIQPFLDRAEDTQQMAIVYAAVKMNLGDHEAAVEVARRHFESPDLSPNARHLLGFTLGRSLESLKRHDEAFEAYRRANEAYPATFDAPSFIREIDQVIETYSSEYLVRLPRSRQTGDKLIFITGLPRSGTTLVERIINTHPQARAAGEVIFLVNLITDMPLTISSDQPYPRCVLDLDRNDVDRLAGKYLEGMRPYSRGMQRVVDKNLSNWRNLGLILLLFPEAKIIHCRRDPLDTCFSCFASALSTLTNAWTADLESIGRVYGQYRRLMTHWMGVSDRPIFEVQYEELIEDQDEISRSLIDFVGLEWDDRCLRFHEDAAAGRGPGLAPTLSYDQVRKPVYSTSRGRSRAFEKHLAPLQAQLEEYE